MAKYEIKITEKDGQERFIACEKISTISDTVAAKKVVLVLEDAFHAGGTVSRSSQNDLRMKVLRGEYLPKNGESFVSVNKRTGKIESSGVARYDFVPGDPLFFYAPTPELAEELSQVIQGKWLPKKGDPCYYLDYDGTTENFESVYFDYEETGRGRGQKYFPSEAQRTAFIKNPPQPGEKKAEEFFEISNGTIYFGTFTGSRTPAVEMLNKMLDFCRSQGMRP